MTGKRKKAPAADDLFFNKLRPWSKIKNEILEKYLTPYLYAVKQLNKSIVIVDSFAGKGKFDEDGVPGSPVIICDAIHRVAPNKARAIFINRKESTHLELEKNIEPFVIAGIARPYHADASTLLRVFRESVTDQTVLIYMDPFGIKGCDFSLIQSFLERGTSYSTEFIINLNMPIIHRYAPRRINNTKDGRVSAESRGQLLTRVLGGDYWDAIFNSGTYDTPEDKDFALIAEYENRLRRHLPYVGSCPVREHHDSQIKYFVIFCSRSPLCMELMNDIMCAAYNEYMHQADLDDIPLFKASSPGWRAERFDDSKEALTKIIIEEVKSAEGIVRGKLWQKIVLRHFRRFTKSEFNKTVKDLVGNPPKLFYTSSTERLNEDSFLYTHDPRV